MKIYFFLPALVSAFLFLQCKSTDNDITDSPATVNITGTILNRDAYPDEKELRLKIPYISGDDYIIKTPIEDDGSFHFQFELNQPQNMSIVTYVEFLYLMPGDNLNITIDFKDLLNVGFSGGKAAAINSDFQNYFFRTGYRSSDFSVGTECERNCSAEEIRSRLDQTKQVMYEKRLDFMMTTKVRDEVAFLTKAMIDLDYYNELIITFWRKSHYGTPYPDPASLKDEIVRKALPYFSKGLYSDSHFKFMGSGFLAVENMIRPVADAKSFPEWLSAIECSDTVRNFSVAIQASGALKSKDLETFGELYSQINMDYMLGRLMKEYEYTLNRMNNAEAISDAIKGKSKEMTPGTLGEENLLSKIIAENEGKIMVINLWTTWCSPCIEEMKTYKELGKNYSGEDLTFFFICAGGNKERSLEILQKEGLSSVPNHFLTGEEFTQLTRTFGMNAFPFGILVNKKGVIVDYGSHIRPEMIRPKIDLLLKQDGLLK
jgi:thiol-disulfide isomerase/thioredoxin